MTKLTVNPDDNVLIGSTVICKYLGITSTTTLIVWHEAFLLPIMKRPDGMWMTTMTAIDEWIWMASQAEAENRAYSRGTNVRADIALERAKARVERQRAFNMQPPKGPAMTVNSTSVPSGEEDGNR